MIAAAPENDLWTSLNRAGTRFLALEGSDYLFLERANTAATLSAGTARELTALGSLASDQSVLLMGQEQRVEALVDLGRIANVRIEDFSRIRAIGLAAGLGHRLGRWARERRRSDGMWIVTFQKSAGRRDDPVRQMLEQQILQPWVEGKRRHDVLFSVNSSDLFESEAKHFRSLAKVQEQLNRVLVGSLIIAGIGAGESGAMRRDLDLLKTDVDLRRVIVSCFEQLKRVQDDLGRVFSDQATQFETKGGEPAAALAHSAEAVVSKLESATETLDAISETLTSATAGSVVSRDVTAPAPEATTPGPDPVQTAIEIRQRLLQSVNLIDAAKWAKWRGAGSKNPSAALGKYKRAHRVFAVRSGNRDLYPAFQFSENAEPLPIVEEILKAVPEDAQGWPLLSWFEARNVTLGGRKPSDLLASDASSVLRAAARFYSRED